MSDPEPHGLLFTENQEKNITKFDVLFMGHRKAVQDTDRMPHNGASDQYLHCLLTECSIKIYNQN